MADITSSEQDARKQKALDKVALLLAENELCTKRLTEVLFNNQKHAKD
jgi:hypothetical protein